MAGGSEKVLMADQPLIAYRPIKCIIKLEIPDDENQEVNTAAEEVAKLSREVQSFLLDVKTERQKQAQEQATALRQSSPAAVVTLFSRPSITFTAPVNGWLLRSPPAQQHTN